MAKRSTDLLDVFRGGGDSRSRAGGKGRGKGGAGKTGRQRERFEGVFLAPQQLLLLGCVVLLLLVLAFMVGLGIGRGGAGDAERGPGLQRTTPAGPPAGLWYVRGFVLGTRVLGGAPVDPRGIMEDLARVDLGPRRFWIQRTEGGNYETLIGPFESRERAERFLNEDQLRVKVGGQVVRRGLRKVLVQDAFPFYRSDERKDVFRR